ncbi:hypothetical protein GWI33_011712 [Rhynchophorus ferrugineus]|uniref:Uncharacterized protein n=1 Tax=Rhynchophorus ferrugineus TaxID=354439 RepID=A0A834IPX6_RHYFE|nr:hypothetical protein GWI33_011712 [Rhynchophorus ferrugineus]
MFQSAFASQTGLPNSRSAGSCVRFFGRQHLSVVNREDALARAADNLRYWTLSGDRDHFNGVFFGGHIRKSMLSDPNGTISIKWHWLNGFHVASFKIHLHHDGTLIFTCELPLFEIYAHIIQ